MTPAQAAEILAAHNKWRRHNSCDSLPPMPMVDPLDLGRAIDLAVKALAAYDALAKEPVAWGTFIKVFSDGNWSLQAMNFTKEQAELAGQRFKPGQALFEVRPLYAAPAPAPSPAESVAFQYLREQVARQMAGVHNALGSGARQGERRDQEELINGLTEAETRASASVYGLAPAQAQQAEPPYCDECGCNHWPGENTVCPTWKGPSQAQQANYRDAYEGAREDLLDWKRRALEAEELNRKFAAAINGPTFMGEPAKAKAKLLTDEQIVECVRSVGQPVPMGLLRDIGHYEITEPRPFARDLVRAIERTCAEAWGVKLAGQGKEARNGE